jgi:lipopolysaccharide biosynthesis glycosyltransferase
MRDVIPIWVGYDQRESVAYHVFCQSVLARATRPVAFLPLAKNLLSGFDGKKDGSNAFIYSRFLIPYLQDFKGHALFFDGDMVCNADVAELWDLRDHYKSVQVVKHDYRTKHPIKYLGNKNEDYEKKNWSSVILWNCAHYHNRILTPEFVAEKPGSFLHRFQWITDAERIGSLAKEWNWLVSEDEQNPHAKIYHYTIGIPSFSEFAKCDHADKWHTEHYNANYSGRLPPNGP